MFITEQQANSIYDYAPAFIGDPALIERHIWSPIACRHVSWTYQPLVLTDGRRIVPGSRRRCPFIA